MPEASTAKAKQILQQLIDAFGGPTYLDIRDSDCEGRLARFGHNGEMSGYTNFKDYWRYPDANRTEYLEKGRDHQSLRRRQGMDARQRRRLRIERGVRGGFSGPSEKGHQQFAARSPERARHDHPLRRTDIVDLKTVDWVDITDSEQRNFRLAVDRSSHLLARAVVSTPDETMNSRNVETNIYTNFQLMDGVRTAMQITTDRNGRRSSQVFFTICKYNSSLPPDLFTKASLDKRFSEVGSRKSKDEKKKEKEEN